MRVRYRLLVLSTLLLYSITILYYLLLLYLLCTNVCSTPYLPTMYVELRLEAADAAVARLWASNVCLCVCHPGLG